MEIGFVKTLYNVAHEDSLKPLLVAIRMVQGILETNISLTIHLTFSSITEGELVMQYQ